MRTALVCHTVQRWLSFSQEDGVGLELQSNIFIVDAGMLLDITYGQQDSLTDNNDTSVEIILHRRRDVLKSSA